MNFREICARLEELLPPTDYYRFIELYNALSVNTSYMEGKIIAMLQRRVEYYSYMERCYAERTEEDRYYVKEIIELLDGFLWYAVTDHEREGDVVFCAYILHLVPARVEE